MSMFKHGKTAAAASLSLMLMVTACSSGGGAVTSKSDKGNPSEAAVAGKPKLPLVSQPTEISWFVPLDSKISATKKSFNEVAIFPLLEKETGIKVNFNHPPTGMEQEQFNLMIASGSLPDMMYYQWLSYPGGPEKALRDGIIIPLNDLVDKNAPNFKKFLNDNPDIKKDIVTDDGKIYSFPVVRKDKWERYVYGLQIRKDWLDKVGLQVPKTMDEWYTVLKAFKEKDPSGTGKVLPFANQTTKPTLAELPLAYFMSAWGMYNGFYQQDGKVKFGPGEPEYKEYLTTMKKWYDEGLIDPDFASTDGKQFDTKVTGNRVGAYGAALNGGMGRYLDLMKKDPDFKLVGVPFPLAKDGKMYNFNREAATGNTGSGNAISSTSKKAAEAVKWMDVAYTEWGNNLFNFGIEGVTYNMVNGYPKYTDVVLKDPALPPTNALAQYTIASSGGRFFNQDGRYFEQILTYPVQKEAADTWAKASTERTLPPITPTSDESSKLAGITSEVYTYSDEMFLKFIMGKEPLTNFDAYLQKLKQMKIDEALKIEQNALDRYKQRK